MLAAQPAPSPRDVRERAWQANNLGVAYLEQFNYAKAATQFEAALAIDGGFVAGARQPGHRAAVRARPAGRGQGRDRCRRGARGTAARRLRARPDRPQRESRGGCACRVPSRAAGRSRRRRVAREPRPVAAAAARVRRGRSGLRQGGRARALQRLGALQPGRRADARRPARTRAPRRRRSSRRCARRATARRTRTPTWSRAATPRPSSRRAPKPTWPPRRRQPDVHDRTRGCPVAPGTRPAPQALGAGDLDRDGATDLVVAGASWLDVYSATRGSALTRTVPQQRPTWPVPSGLDPRGVVVADVDNDGKPDLLLHGRGGVRAVAPGRRPPMARRSTSRRHEGVRHRDDARRPDCRTRRSRSRRRRRPGARRRDTRRWRRGAAGRLAQQRRRDVCRHLDDCAARHRRRLSRAPSFPPTSTCAATSTSSCSAKTGASASGATCATRRSARCRPAVGLDALPPASAIAVGDATKDGFPDIAVSARTRQQRARRRRIEQPLHGQAPRGACPPVRSPHRWSTRTTMACSTSSRSPPMASASRGRPLVARSRTPRARTGADERRTSNAERRGRNAGRRTSESRLPTPESRGAGPARRRPVGVDGHRHRCATARRRCCSRRDVAAPAFRVALTGQVSNRSGVGAKVEMRAGSLWQKLETSASLAGRGAGRRAVRPRHASRRRRRARAVARRHRAGRADRRRHAEGAHARGRRTRSQAVVVPVPLHVEWRALRVRHRLSRRRRDGLPGLAWRVQHARPRGVRPHPRRSVARARRPLRAARDQRARGDAVPRSPVARGRRPSGRDRRVPARGARVVARVGPAARDAARAPCGRARDRCRRP